jgi:hypothetical protein
MNKVDTKRMQLEVLSDALTLLHQNMEYYQLEKEI